MVGRAVFIIGQMESEEEQPTRTQGRGHAAQRADCAGFAIDVFEGTDEAVGDVVTGAVGNLEILQTIAPHPALQPLGLEPVLREGDLVLVQVEAMDDMAAGGERLEQAAGTAGRLEHAHRPVELRTMLLHDPLDEAGLLRRVIRIDHVVIQRGVVPGGGGVFRRRQSG